MFRYFVSLSIGALPRLIGEKLKDVYLKPEIAAKCYAEGGRVGREIYGDRVRIPGASAPGISYIHLSTLGAELKFPEEEGEPNIRPINFASIDDAIECVERPVNFAECEWVKWSRDYARRLGDIVGKKIAPTMGLEGPITSAALLCGNGFYGDLLAEPEKSKRFLKSLTNSVIDFFRFVRGSSEIGKSHGICDDLSSLVGPNLWPEFVLPYWDQLYSAFTNSYRGLHCENLSEDHLHMLNEVGISHFDPSHSPKLRPWMLKKHLRMPWNWRVQAVHALEGCDRIRREIQEAAENGASTVPMYVCQPEMTPEHVQCFFETAEKFGGKPS